MKNRIMALLIGLFMFIAIPTDVFATSGSLILSCNDVTIGNTKTCSMKASVTGGSLVTLEFDIEANSNVSIDGVTLDSATWNVGTKYRNGHVTVSAGARSGSAINIGTITIKGVTAGTGKITLKNIEGGDANWDTFSISNTSDSFNVTVATTKSTTKSTTKTTTKKGQTTTTQKGQTTKRTTTTTKKGQSTVRTTTQAGGGSGGNGGNGTTNKATTTTTRYGQTTTPGGGSGGSQGPGAITNPSSSTTRNTVGPITNPSTPTGGQGPITGPLPGATTEPQYTIITNDQGEEITRVPITNRTSINYITNEAGEIIRTEIINRTDIYYTDPADKVYKPFQQNVLGIKQLYVDHYRVMYKEGKYYVTTDPNDEEVEITAEPTGNAIVLGTGTRGIAVGKNVVDLIIKEGLDTRTVQLVITRPSDVNVGDTKLTSLKVVDKEFTFDPNVKEYTISVPYTTKELYVIAKHMSEDATIGGDGLNYISENEMEALYIQVAYGSLPVTEYIIHIKKDYTMLILWIVIGLLVLGIIGMALYAYFNRKEAVSKVTAQKDAVIASGNRVQLNEVAKDAVIGGDRLGGLTRRTVKPTPVGEQRTVVQPSERPTGPTPLPVKPTPVTPTPVKPVEMSTEAPQPQVRLIKKNEQPQIIPVNENPYKEDSIVIKDL